MSESIWSSCPIVRDEVLQLWERLNVGGKDRFIPFECRILWLRQSETKIVLRHDGVLVDERSTLNDFYGFLTSLESSITDDARSLSNALHVGLGDRLAVELDVTISDVPVLKDQSEEAKSTAERYAGKRYRRSFLAAKSRRDDRPYFTSDRPVSSERYAPYPTLRPMICCEVEGIFSSQRLPCDRIPPSIAEFIERHRSLAAGVEVLSPREREDEISYALRRPA